MVRREIPPARMERRVVRGPRPWLIGSLDPATPKLSKPWSRAKNGSGRKAANARYVMLIFCIVASGARTLGERAWRGWIVDTIQTMKETAMLKM